MLRVLVVEDEPDLREVVSAALRRAGHEALAAENGGAGLAALEAERFDAVVTDVFMPEADGIELIRALRAANRREPVLAMSGGGNYGNESLLPMAKTLGAQGTLRKPFTPSELVAAVEAIARGVAVP